MSGGSEMDTDGKKLAVFGVCADWGRKPAMPKRSTETQLTKWTSHITDFHLWAAPRDHSAILPSVLKTLVSRAGMWITIGYSDKTSKRRGKSTSLCCPVSGSDASACRRIGHSATPVKTHRFRTTCDLTVPQQNPNEPSSTHE